MPDISPDDELEKRLFLWDKELINCFFKSLVFKALDPMCYFQVEHIFRELNQFLFHSFLNLQCI